MRVLLVEDDPPLAEIIARNLSARGYDAAVAGTGEEAVANIAAAPPDVLILDVNLPDMTGWDVLRRVERVQRAAIRVIVVSAGPVSPKRIEEFHPDRHLEKPFPIGALMRLLTELEPAEQKEEK
jgi:two-component system KDP operon response regulator KdpE